MCCNVSSTNNGPWCNIFFLSLVAWCHSFQLYWFSFHTYNTFTHSDIHKHSLRLSIPSSLNSSVADTSLGCRAGIRTRARLTASRRATNWATPHCFILFRCVLFWRIFWQLQITFAGVGGWGRGGFLLAKYYAELLLIGCMAWFDYKRRHLPIWDVYLLK